MITAAQALKDKLKEALASVLFQPFTDGELRLKVDTIILTFEKRKEGVNIEFLNQGVCLASDYVLDPFKKGNTITIDKLELALKINM